MEENVVFRQHCNGQILEILRLLIQRHPTLRFGQLLMITKVLDSYFENESINIEDPFNEESEVTLKRVLATLSNQELGL
jgi:hypothetical protein